MSSPSTAMRVTTHANVGAYLSTFGTLIPTYVYAPLLSGQYDIPAIHCNVILFDKSVPIFLIRRSLR